MLLSSRSLRRSVFCLSWILSGICVAQQGKPQFNAPEVDLTGGRVASLLPGSFQPPGSTSGPTDILYIDAPTVSGTTSSVTAGELLNKQGFYNLNENQIVFSNVLNVTAALADLDNDGHTDYAFALSPAVAGATNLCVYYGTGAAIGVASSYSGGNAYPPSGGKSGCTTFPTQGTLLPNLTYIAAAPFKTGNLPQLIVEDSANNYIYILANSGTLTGISLKSAYAIPVADGAGPIYTGDFNGDGNTDFIINGRTGLSASVYFGNGDGTFQAPVRYTFDHNVHSMLIQDMDGDGVADMVVEGDRGVIEIFKGSNTTGNPFASQSEGGTAAGLDGFSGNGGHLAAIGKLGNSGTLSILTTTPIGLSVLEGQGGLAYTLKGIYNVGPGRSSFALEPFEGDGNLDLAIDSPEGVAIVQGNADGSFHTSSAYAALQPALGAAVGEFTASGNLDVVVVTGTTQAQLLTGNGDGTFHTFPSPANTQPGPNPNPTLWSAILTGDFDGDGKSDIAYSLTGLPLPTPGAMAGTGLYIQYGNGDGTFTVPYAVTSQLVGAPVDNNFYGESAVADFNGDGITDIANLDTLYYDTLLSQKSAGAFTLGLNVAEDSGSNPDVDLDSFSQVAAGVFAGSRTTQQDLVFQDDANITPYVNNGNGASFTAMPALSNPPAVSDLYGGTIIIADIDKDGCGDVIVPYHNLASDPANPSAFTPNQLYIWYGNCDGTFGAPQIMPLSRNYYLGAVVDMNGDGLPDLVLSDGYVVSILYNLGNLGNPPNRTFGGEQHFLAGQGINSLSLVDVNGDGALDLVVANGGATISDAVAIGGKKLDASNNPPTSIGLTPNPDVNTGGITVLLNNILTKPATGTLMASPEPSQFGTAFTLTATVAAQAVGGVAPTGTVQFAIDGTAVGTPAPLAPGATFSTATYTVPAGNTYLEGEHALTATYSGDANYSPVTLVGNHIVQGSTSSTVLALCVGPTAACPSTGFVFPPVVAMLTMYYGQDWNGTAQVTAADGGTLPGSINFYDLYNGTSTLLCTLQASTGGACPPSVGTTEGTSVGTNIFTAVYSGDSNHTGSTSNTVTIDVLPDTTTATLTGSPNPSPQGRPVTFTATLTGNFAPPTGTVIFLESFPPTSLILQLGTATLVPGSGLTSTATFTTATLPVGTDTIGVSYAANVDFAAANATTTEVITPVIATATTLTSSSNPSVFGQNVTFTATVSLATGSPAPVPTGTVTFLDGATALGTGTLNGSGVATFSTSTLAVGSHTITANASGDSATAPSSASLVQVVKALPPPGSVNFTITVTPNPVTVGVGYGTVLTVTVTALDGFPEGVNLACASLPTEAACTFGNAAMAAGGGTTTLFLNTAAPHSCGTNQPYFLGGNGGGPSLAPFALPALAGLIAMFLPGRRRWLRSLVAVVAVAGLAQIVGCGNCTDLGTRPATYTFQVTGTAAAGTPEVESQAVTLNVTI